MAVKTEGERGYFDMPVHVRVDSWQVLQDTDAMEAWICAPVGAGLKKPDAPPQFTAPVVAFGLINPAGVLAKWQFSQLALFGAGM